MREAFVIKFEKYLSINLKSKGFTLTELMLTLAIAGIMLGFALPAFDNFLANINQTAAVNEKIGILNYARNEAINRPSTITVNITDDDGDGDYDWVVKDGVEILKVFGAQGQANFSIDHNRTTLITYESSGFRLFSESESKIDICNKVRKVGKQVIVSKSGSISIKDIGGSECS